MSSRQTRNPQQTQMLKKENFEARRVLNRRPRSRLARSRREIGRGAAKRRREKSQRQR